MGSAGEQCDKKWMVNRLLGERRAERRVSEQQKGVSGRGIGRGEREGRRAGLWGQLWSRAKEQRKSKSGEGEVVEEKQLTGQQIHLIVV